MAPLGSPPAVAQKAESPLKIVPHKIVLQAGVRFFLSLLFSHFTRNTFNTP
jgi:hypothetical protein